MTATRPAAARRAPPRALLLRLLLVVAGLAATALPAAAGAPAAEGEAAPFAALQVVAHGDQEFDLATGVTTLPEGGEIVDQETGVRLVAAVIRYRDGDFIEAEGAEIEGRFGVATAARLRVDIATGLLEAAGGLELAREGLRLRADDLRYDADAEVVRFSGDVVGEAPPFEAAAAVLDLDTGSVVLVGPYRFEDGLFTLRAPAEGVLLELVPVETASGPSYAAASELSAALIERLGPFLP